MSESTIITRQNVKIVPLENPESGELANRIHYQCAFCEKTVGLYNQQRKVCEKLSGEQFYCVFCLRHGFHTRSNRNVLPLSFRAITGFYYFEKYIYTNQRQIWLSEIQDFLDMHEVVGLQNPLFSYDPETFMWFIDFNRVGRGKKKIKTVEIHKTIMNILSCFNLWQHIPNIRRFRLLDKYSTAIDKFYTQRYRPPEKRLLIPTLAGCGPFDNKKFALDSTKLFMPRHLTY